MPKLVFTYQQNKAASGEEEIITTDTEPEMDFGNNLNVEPDTMSIISKHSNLDVRTLMDKMETVRLKQKSHSSRKLHYSICCLGKHENESRQRHQVG